MIPDINQILLIAQAGAQVFALGKVGIEDLLSFMGTQGADKEKIAALRIQYAQAITDEQAEIDKYTAPAAPSA
jgi:hypothetical protein